MCVTCGSPSVFLLWLAMRRSLVCIPFLAFACFSSVVMGVDTLSFMDAEGNVSKEHKEPAGFAVHNRVLFKVDEETVVTTLDVIHRLNVLFYTSYPQLLDTLSARLQYYTAMWPVVLESAIDEAMMVADAKVKHISIDPTSVNQEIESAFGKDLSRFCDLCEMTPQDVFNVVHRSLTAQRVLGMMVQSKVMLKVTPGKIKEYYNQLAEEAANTVVWNYKILTVKASSDPVASKIAERVQSRLQESPNIDEDRLSALALSLGGTISCSEVFSRSEKDLSDAHRQELSSIAYPETVCSFPKKHSSGYKLFVVVDKTTQTIGSLEDLQQQIRQTLFVSYLKDIEAQYKSRLRTRYGCSDTLVSQLLSEKAPPLFSLL